MGPFTASGTYLENSALDAFLRDPAAFGGGPFVISEFCLAEKARLPPEAYRAFILGMSGNRVRMLAVPPLSQIIFGNLESEWRGVPFRLVDFNVAAALSHQQYAQARLDALCAGFAVQFRQLYAEWRPKHTAWLAACDASGGGPNPRSQDYLRNSILQATLQKLGISKPPTPDAPLPQRLHWNISTWEAALVLTRLDRTNADERDLRNDAIDAVHYALAATFCERIAVRERTMKRIWELLPEPRLPFLRVTATDVHVEVAPAA